MIFFLITAKTDEVLKAKESMKEEKAKEEGEPNFKIFNRQLTEEKYGSLFPPRN